MYVEQLTRREFLRIALLSSLSTVASSCMPSVPGVPEVKGPPKKLQVAKSDLGAVTPISTRVPYVIRYASWYDLAENKLESDILNPDFVREYSLFRVDPGLQTQDSATRVDSRFQASAFLIGSLSEVSKAKMRLAFNLVTTNEDGKAIPYDQQPFNGIVWFQSVTKKESVELTRSIFRIPPKSKFKDLLESYSVRFFTPNQSRLAFWVWDNHIRFGSTPDVESWQKDDISVVVSEVFRLDSMCPARRILSFYLSSLTPVNLKEGDWQLDNPYNLGGEKLRLRVQYDSYGQLEQMAIEGRINPYEVTPDIRQRDLSEIADLFFQRRTELFNVSNNGDKHTRGFYSSKTSKVELTINRNLEFAVIYTDK